jgi:uncharacterized phage protein (TIGR02218 family)
VTRALDPAYAAALASGATSLVTCWRIARADGRVIGLTDHDRPIAFGGLVYDPEAGGEGAAHASTADLAVDNTEVAGFLSPDGLDADELAAGRYDGAEVEIWRVDWRDPAVRHLMMRGRIGEVRREGARFTAEIRGRAGALDQIAGRVYQRRCDADLGDARCRADLDAPGRRAEGEVLAVVDGARFSASGLSGFPADWFAGGRLDWLTGLNAGARSHVRAHSGAAIDLWAPPGLALAPGDRFHVAAGCDKSFGTCRDKFANALNFRGFHLMPGDDAAIAIAPAPARRERGKG